jgi:hypothetical protein
VVADIAGTLCPTMERLGVATSAEIGYETLVKECPHRRVPIAASGRAIRDRVLVTPVTVSIGESWITAY